jgi:hypothetical protein
MSVHKVNPLGWSKEERHGGAKDDNTRGEVTNGAAFIVA